MNAQDGRLNVLPQDLELHNNDYTLTPETVIRKALTGPAKWRAFTRFCNVVIKAKQDLERTRERTGRMDDLEMDIIRLFVSLHSLA